MPKRKTPEEKPEEQFKRFQTTANELGVDQNSEIVEAAFKKLAKNADHSARAKRKDS